MVTPPLTCVPEKASLTVGQELFADVTPRTAENFRQFCTGESKDPTTGKPQGYKDTKFHRVVCQPFVCFGTPCRR
jgi:cyclophilin family peptidyl-prolyl cis-trans isomerase